MQITVTIKDKDIKTAVAEMADYTLSNYDDKTRKIARAPSVAALTKAIMADEKYMANVKRRITNTIQTLANDHIYEDILHADCPTTAALEVQLDAAQEQARMAEEAERQKMAEIVAQEAEAAMVNRMVSALKKAGYRVEKA